MPLLSTTPRHVIDVALMLTLLGNSVPYGIHDLRSYAINRYEIALAVLSFIAAIGIAIDIFAPQPYPWPFELAAFVWFAAAAYVAVLPGGTIAARIGLCVIATGIGSLAGGTWRWQVLERHAMRHPDQDKEQP
ncbi:MAG: hypothetical protein J2P16_14300 [Mycobacterium sp.]|nr:hypothetical protein [Mycobacterium sp.]